MTVLYILDSNERIKGVLEDDIYGLSHVSKIADGTEDTGKLNKIWSETLSFAVPSINSNATLLDIGVKIVNIDDTGKMKMFNVYDVSDGVRGNIHVKNIVAYNACIWDLYKTYTEPYEWTYADPQTVFTNIFNNTGWTVTEIFDDGAVREAAFSIARGTKQAAMDAALKLFEAEAEAWVEIVDGQIVKKVKIVDNLGLNKRHRFEYRQNIKGLSRQKLETDFFTRLYVFGGTPAGETTPISIAPANNGMEYITDYDAQDKYVPGNRTVDGVITNEKITNPVALLAWAEKQMSYYNHPKFQYTVDVALFKEKPNLGDTAVVVDFEMDPVLTVEARVVETNYGETNSITLGEFTTIDASQLDLSKIQDMINRVEGTVGSLSGQIGGIKENVKDVQDGLKELDGVKEDVEDLLAYLTDEQKQQLADAIKDLEAAKERIEAAEEKMKNSPNVSMGELTPANPKEGDIHYYQNADGIVESKVIYEGGKWVVQQSQDDIKNLLENEVPNFVKELEKVETNVTEFDKKMNDARESILALDTNIGTINTQIGSVKETVIALNTDIGTIQTNVGTLNTNIGTINTEIGSVKETVIELDTNIGTIGDVTEGLQTKVQGIEGDVSTLTQTANGLATRVGDAEGNISTLTQTANGIQTKVSTVENNLSNLKIGGRNLFIKSNNLKGFGTSHTVRSNTDGSVTVILPKGANDNFVSIPKSHVPDFVYELFAPGEELTISFDAVIDTGISSSVLIYFNANMHYQKHTNGTLSTKKNRISQTRKWNLSTGISHLHLKFENVSTTEENSFTLSNFKLERGNKATDWTPAPEDTDAKFSEVTQTIDGIATRVGNSEGNISTLTQTANGLATRVSTTEGNISTLTQTANGLATRVSTTEGNISTLTQTAQGIQTKVSSVETNLNNLQIGGRNLFLYSNKLGSLSASHALKYNNDGSVTVILPKGSTGENYIAIQRAHIPDEVYSSFINGEDITISFDVIVNSGAGAINIYFNNAMYYAALTKGVLSSSKSRVSQTRKWATGTTANRVHLQFYNLSATEENSFTLSNFKLERGNKATDWTPAPEDTDAKFSEVTQTIDGIATRVGNSEGNISTLTQTANGLATRVSTTEGNISTLTQTANGLATRVSTTEGNISTLTQTAQGIQTKVSSVETNLNNLQIGGRNLWLNSKKFSIGSKANGITTAITSEGYLKIVATAGNGNWFTGFTGSVSNISQVLTENEKFTLSFEIMKEAGSTGNPKLHMSDSMTYLTMNGDIGVGKFTTISHTRDFKGTSVLSPHLGLSECVGTFYIKSIKLERGNKATDWTPAPEDTDAKFSEITQTVNGISTRVGTAEGNISTLTQTANGLQATVQGFDKDNTIASKFTQMSNAINLRVVSSGIIDAINQVNQIDINNRGILIDASKININGSTVFTNLRDKVNGWASGSDATKIDGGKIYTGSITATQIKVSNLASLNANLGAITGGSLNIGNKFIVDSLGNLTATSATITGKVTATSGTFTGTINAESGTITGSMVVSGTLSGGTISGATITTTKDITVGTKLYLSTGSDMGIQFGSSSTSWNNSYIRSYFNNLSVKSAGDLSLVAEQNVSIYNATGGIYGGGALQLYDFGEYRIWGISSGTINWRNNGALDEKTYGEHKVTAMSQNDMKFVTSNNTMTIGGKSAGVHFKNWNDTNYVPANASAFTVNSRRADKKNIVPFSCALGQTALDKVMQTPIYNYHYNNELDAELQHTGVILEEAPVEIADPSGIGVDVYAMVSVLWKAVQEQQAIIEDLRSRIN